MSSKTGTRRVRHEVADGIGLMLFSLGASIVLTLVISAALGLL